MDKQAKGRLNVVLSMFIYGTIGVFARYISLPTPVTAMIRGLVGALFLLLILAVSRRRPDMAAIKRNLPLLCLLGVFLGANWILLFEAYRYTTVATATLCYYLAPIILVALSPLSFGEKISLKKALCVLAALVGMVFVSGVAENGIPAPGELKGVLLALGAACFYAGIVTGNKKLKDISGYDRTVAQLVVSALALLPYNLLAGNFRGGLSATPLALLMLLVLSLVHTGLAYALYFGSMEALSSQTLAILSYIDPVVAVLLSAMLLKEPLSLYGIAGALLILGAALISELPERRKRPAEDEPEPTL